jgi:hypothetical protein
VPLSVVDICNDALLNIGQKSRIESLEGSEPAAKACKLVYQRLVDEMLERRRWHFAEKRSVLTELSGLDPVTGWQYIFAAPTDMLAPRGFWNGQVEVTPDLEPIYEMAAHPTSGLPVFLTNERAPELIYTARVLLPSVFTPLFARALGWALSAKLAPALADSASLMKFAQDMAVESESEAWASDLNNRRKHGIGTWPNYLRTRSGRG